MSGLPTPRPLSKGPARMFFAGEALVFVSSVMLLWLGALGHLTWWFLALGYVPSLLCFASTQLGDWTERRRIERLGYALRRWEFFSIGRSPAGRYQKMEEARQRLRARSHLPHRDQVAVAPAFAGLSDAEMVNFALELLFDNAIHARERDTGSKRKA